MEQESIMNSVEHSTGQVWSSKSNQFAKLVSNVKQLKSDDNSFLLLLNEQQADKEDLSLPRQAYGIDFYGHTHGEILVAIDLCTREVSLWFLPDRKMEGVAKALLSGIIFQRGVPLIFVNDEAQEFVGGVDTA